MKKIIRIICTLLLFSMLMSTFVAVSAAENNSADERTGIEMKRVKTGSTTHVEGYYTTDKKLDKIPVTYEAWVYIPSESYNSASGIILGTMYDLWDDSWKEGTWSNDVHFSFGVKAGGHPCLVYGKLGQAQRIWEFSDPSVVIPADKWTHVTICHDAREGNKFVWCMIDGDPNKVQKSGTDNFPRLGNTIFDNHLCLGGDNFRGNSHAPKDMLFSDVAVYADVRSYDEVKSDYENGADVNDKDLILYYQISSENQNKDIKDVSGNGYDMNFYRIFLTEAEMREIRKQDKHEYAYSIAVLPDYQYISGRYPQSLNTIFKYLVNNKESKNIQYVITVGDMTDKDTDGEWAGVKTQYAILDKAGIPYTVVRGNHDGNGAKFNKVFGKGTQYYKHVEENGGFYNKNSAANTYVLFDTEEVKYLILNLDWGITSTKILDWADDVIEAHPDRRVIVTLHSYLNCDGTLLEKGDWAAPSGYDSGKSIDPDQMWKNYFSKHNNIDMIIGGHMHSDNILVTPATGANGNVVQQLLIDSQFSELSTGTGGFGALGLIAFMYFTEDGSHAKIEYYSTTYKRYYYEKNTEISLDFGAPTVDVGGEVTLDRRDVAEGEFTFTLRWADRSFALLENVEPIKTTNKADGSFVFENIKVNNAGIYYFVISQDITQKEHITFDASIYHVTVRVAADGNGGFKVSGITFVKKGSTEAEEALVFANAYTGPVKQDTSLTWIWIAAGALVGVGVVAGALVLVLKKKRAKKA